MSATTFITRLTKEECLHRLQSRTGREGWQGWNWIPWEEGTIAVQTRGERFGLYAWGPLWVRNSFAPLFFGSLEQAEDEVWIRGRFRCHRLVQAFLLIWFGAGLTGLGLLLWLPAEAWSDGKKPPLLAAALPLAMIVVGALWLRLNQWFVRGQTDSIHRFLRSELLAEDSMARTPRNARQATTTVRNS